MGLIHWGGDMPLLLLSYGKSCASREDEILMPTYGDSEVHYEH